MGGCLLSEHPLVRTYVIPTDETHILKMTHNILD